MSASELFVILYAMFGGFVLGWVARGVKKQKLCRCGKTGLPILTADPAESALRELVRQIYPATSHIEYDGIKTRAECVAEYESFIDEKLRALLTVAAQTTQSKDK